MKLADYMDRHGLGDAEMAKRLDVSRAQVSRLRRHLSRPSWALLDRLASATDGAVTPNDFFDLPSDSEAA